MQTLAEQIGYEVDFTAKITDRYCIDTVYRKTRMFVRTFVNTSGKEIHHVDGNVRNARFSNLMVLTHSEHMRLEHGWKHIAGVWYKKCPVCKKFFSEGEYYERQNGRVGGAYVYCKPCCSSIAKKYYQRKIRSIRCNN